ncbi:hypothetical protein DY052_07605 [Apilactobacillus timberlakei]|uniref:hypothetical protein n=1 Tax=Apilactobacillus timberlakei TaxID=2008380 RepID=UPI001128D5F7|nr:hypothetical protein [Apilactobacillus timberlakei]TPR13719.1 hypothetical protein DY052_07605 [Apilactobacillus timberlakei]
MFVIIKIDDKFKHDLLKNNIIYSLLEMIDYSSFNKVSKTENKVNNYLKATSFFNSYQNDKKDLIINDYLRSNCSRIFNSINELKFKYDSVKINDNIFNGKSFLREIRLNDELSIVVDGGYLLKKLINFNHTILCDEPDIVLEEANKFMNHLNLISDFSCSFNIIKVAHHSNICNNPYIYSSYYELIKHLNGFINQDKFDYKAAIKQKDK